MSKKTFFIHQHPLILQDHGDGLALVFRKNDRTRILFYDEEHDALFSDYNDLEASLIQDDFSVVPASLEEIGKHGFIFLVDAILQYDDATPTNVRYIHL